MSEFDRQKYIDKIEKESSTVGIKIPETMNILNEEIPVKDIVTTKDADKNPKNIENIKRKLIKERSKLFQKIKSDNNLTEDKADKIVKKINRIDRIINSFNSDNQSFEDKSKVNKAKKMEKWKNFVDKIKDN